MSRTADNSTPQALEAPGSRLLWREALKRAGSFDELQPLLHLGRIPARHGALYSWPDIQLRSGPGDVKPEWWAHAYVQAGRVIFFSEPVVMEGRVVQEELFAYAVSIDFDRAAFEVFFPVADLPPAEHSRPLPTQTVAPKKRSRKKAAPKKQSRKKAVYQSAQTVRARAVLDRIFPEKKYPTKGQIPWPELRNAFAEEYERYMKDNPSKLSAKPAKKLSMPSDRTLRRALGWE